MTHFTSFKGSKFGSSLGILVGVKMTEFALQG
jgi:hypothetical protein